MKHDFCESNMENDMQIERRDEETNRILTHKLTDMVCILNQSIRRKTEHLKQLQIKNLRNK